MTQGNRTQVDTFNTTGQASSHIVDLSLAPIPLGTQLAAETHSHPDQVGFSGEDVDRAHLLTVPGLHYPEFQGEYVGLPDNTVVKYDPHTGGQTTFPPGQPQ